LWSYSDVAVVLEKAEPVTERAILPRPITTTANSFKVVSWNVDGTTLKLLFVCGVTGVLQWCYSGVAEPVTERAILPRPITTTANSFKVVSWNVDGTTFNCGVTDVLQ
jgi:hypothetical protein